LKGQIKSDVDPGEQKFYCSPEYIFLKDDMSGGMCARQIDCELYFGKTAGPGALQ
jgi:hypothetical protein